MNLKKEIASWLDNFQQYQDGVAILAQLGDPLLPKLECTEPSYLQKQQLAERLLEIYNRASDTQTLNKSAETTSITDTPSGGKLPDAVVLLFRERSRIHEKLTDPERMVRYQAACDIKELTRKINHYYDTGCLPAAKETSTNNTPAALNVNNIRSRISKLKKKKTAVKSIEEANNIEDRIQELKRQIDNAI